METLERLLDLTRPWHALAETLVISILVLWGFHQALLGRHKSLSAEKQFARQLIMLGLTLIAITANILALPVSEGMHAQILGFVGLLVSGAFAFSSTTIFSNIMAGIMLRVTRPFRIGDYIRVQNHFGRVADRGLLDTEIQTESREFVSLPNSLFVQTPVSVIRSSGTLISCQVSIGYDVSHLEIERLLKQAAETCELAEAFVIVEALGDFSVQYRVSGLLEDIGHLVSKRSALHAAVLDALHGAGIEIMSPNVMAQRPLPPDARLIPHPVTRVPEAPDAPKVEDIAFDTVLAKEDLLKRKAAFKEKLKQLKARLDHAEGDARKQIETAIRRIEAYLDTLETARDELNDARKSSDT
ncbi:MAG: mechanosensitive ion channel family protein [Gammaproteobacteria bacterium]|nr:MAG: mechanosensitive ion channel family protein [Gammaproteobacteria bacterium]